MRILELRVHGVSNTPPQSVLLAASAGDVKRVAGDDVTGFYRRNDQDPRALVSTEAYSWGQLTGGVRAKKDLYRALWMLLLPFAFVNVAFWARTRFPAGARSDGLTSYLGRLLAASLTVTLILAATGVGVDLVGWQWEHATKDVKNVGWLNFINLDPGAAHKGRPLAFGLLLPAAILLAVWFVARRSFAYEAEAPALGKHPPPPIEGLHMSDSNFWRGNEQVKRLSSIHVALGAVAACAVAAAPMLRDDLRTADGSRWNEWLLVALLAVTAAGALVALALPVITERGATSSTKTTRWFTPMAALLFVLTATYLGFGDNDRPPGEGLPGYDHTIRTVFLCQFVTVMALALSVRWSPRPARAGVGVLAFLAVVASLVSVRGAAMFTQRWPLELLPDAVKSPDHRAAFLIVATALVAAAVLALALPIRTEHDATPPAAPATTANDSVSSAARPAHVDSPAWRAAGSALLGGLGLMLAALYAAGVIFYVADWLNGDGAPEATQEADLRLPVALEWAASGLVPVAVLFGLYAVGRYALLRRAARAMTPAVYADYNADSEHERARAATVAQARALHDFVANRLLGVVGRFAGFVVLPLMIAGTAAAATGLRAEALLDGPAESVVVASRDSGIRFSILLLAGIVLVGGLVYRAKPSRRGVGIIWDLATFWPRACHPFAPPCYAERCVPQLVTRIAGDDVADGFVLAGHSQGAVLSVAGILQLPSHLRQRIFLLTFGTQLHRLYGRVFPAFFGPPALQRIAAHLEDHRDDPVRRWLRWRSLYRATDPLGYPVDVTLPASDGGASSALCVDHPGMLPHAPIRDPEALHPVPKEILDPPIRKHSDYPADAVFTAVRDDAAARLAGLVPDVAPGPARAGAASTNGTRDRPTAPTSGARGAPAATSYEFSYDGRSRQVLVHGTNVKGAVVLLHDFRGVNTATDHLAETIARQGYEVHVPALIGEPGQNSAIRGAWQVYRLREEFVPVAGNRTGPLVDWSRALCRHVMGTTGDRKIGVVGIGLTGGMAVACALDVPVAAVVSLQPRLPLALSPRRRKLLGLSQADLDRARQCPTPILAVRSETNRSCPRERLEALAGSFPNVRTQTLPRGLELPRRSPPEDLMSQLLDFLDLHVANR